MILYFKNCNYFIYREQLPYTEVAQKTTPTLPEQAVQETLKFRKKQMGNFPASKNCATVLIEYTEGGKTKIGAFSAYSQGLDPRTHAERLAWDDSESLRNRQDITITKIAVHSERATCGRFNEDPTAIGCKDFFNDALRSYDDKAVFVCSIRNSDYSKRVENGREISVSAQMTNDLEKDIQTANQIIATRSSLSNSSLDAASASTSSPRSQTRGSDPVASAASSPPGTSLQSPEQQSTKKDKRDPTKPTIPPYQITSESLSSKLSALNTAAEQKRNIGETLSSPNSTLKTIPRFMFLRHAQQYLLSPIMKTEKEANELKTQLSGLLQGKVNEDSIKKVSSDTNGQWQIKVEGTEDELRAAHKIINP